MCEAVTKNFLKARTLACLRKSRFISSAARADTLYIGDGNDNTVKGFDADTGTRIDFGNGNTGIFVTTGSGGLHGPRGLIFNQSGNLVVANQNIGLYEKGIIEGKSLVRELKAMINAVEKVIRDLSSVR